MQEKIKISQPFQELLATLTAKEKIAADQTTIKVGEMVGKVSFFYEKIRNVVDYRDEHLLRKNAIERILKRQIIVEQKTDSEKMAQTLIYEMIRARYLENDTVPESRVKELSQSIKRAKQIIKSIKPENRQAKKSIKFFYGLLACELDEKLVSHRHEQALAQTMYDLMSDKILLTGKHNLKEEEKNTQIYLSIHRSLLKYDQEMTGYLLLKMYFPDWAENFSTEFIKNFIKQRQQYELAINQQLNHPLREKFNKLFRKYAVLFSIFQEFVQGNEKKASQILEQPDIFGEEIIKICEQKYKQTRLKLRRAATRTIIYIFITKMALALALEIPFDLWLLNHLNYTALGVNILFHPFLMFVLAMSVQVPSEKNTKLIKINLKRIIYKTDDATKYKIKLATGGSSFMLSFFKVLYALTFIISFGALIYLLQKLGFNTLSTILFVVFLSIVSFFGIRIRQTAQELVVTKKKEGILNALADFFFIPIVRAGRWISLNFSKINVFVFVLDFIIEAPLKTILEISEQWFAYVKEKKEEIY